jgi:hypothetical protein
MGAPGQTGHCSPAAWSHTVTTKSIAGAGPTLRAQIGDGVILAAQEIEREGMDLTGGVTAGAVGPEAALADAIQDALGQDAAARVTGAEEQ